jgi:hypothetical protein
MLVAIALVAPQRAVLVGQESQAQRFLQLINDYRLSEGESALKLSSALTAAAQGHSDDMATRNYFSHTTPEGVTFDQRIREAGYTYSTALGENIAAGYETADSVFAAWKSSPGHNSNMLSAMFVVIGIGLAYNEQSTYRYYWTTDFGGYDDTGTQPPPSPPTKSTSSLMVIVNSTSVAVGTALIVSGSLTPHLSDVSVIISLAHDGGDWTDLTVVATDQQGEFSYCWTNASTDPGSYEVRASWDGNDEYYGSYAVASFTVVRPDFLVSVSPSLLSVVVGRPGNNATITVKSNYGFSSPVTISVSDAPNGSLVELSLTELRPIPNSNVSCVMSVAATWDSVPGDYHVNVWASSAQMSERIDVTVRISLPPPNMTISVAPKVVLLPRVSEWNSSLHVTVTSSSNYTLRPSIDVVGIPGGLTAIMRNDTPAIERYGSHTSDICFVVASAPPSAGNYTLQVMCRCGNVTKSDNLTLVVVEKLPSDLHMNVSSALAKYGDRLVVNGSLTPAEKAEVVATVYCANGTPVVTSEVATSDLGIFSCTIPISMARGEYRLCVAWDGDGAYYGASSEEQIEVERIATVITLHLNTTSLTVGQSLLLSGNVSDSLGLPVGDSDVSVTVRSKNATWSAVCRTNAAGEYNLTVGEFTSGRYSVSSQFEGDPFHEPSQSPTTDFEVLEQSQDWFSMAYVCFLGGGLVAALILEYMHRVSNHSGSPVSQRP